MASRLLDLVEDGDRILAATGTGEPRTLLRRLVEEVFPARKNLEVIQVSMGGEEYLAEAAAEHGHRLRFPVGGRRSERAISEGRAESFPTTMYQLSTLITSGQLRIDGALMAGARRNDGTLSPGLSLDVIGAASRAARYRCLEVVSGLPRTRSVPWLNESDCDLVLEVDEAAAIIADLKPSAVQLTLGHHLAELIEPGATLELGVGTGFRGLAPALCDAGVTDIALHTGLIAESSQMLVDRGVVTRFNPCCKDALIVGGAARGSQGFYDWLNNNPRVCLAESSDVHNVAHLVTLPQFMAINSASQIDLFGQVGTPFRHILGSGGLLDFATAGAYSAGSVIALTARNNRDESRIVPAVPHVGLSAQLVTHIVTEFGAAHLYGKTLRERADSVIAVAHPEDRSALRRAAEQLLC